MSEVLETKVEQKPEAGKLSREAVDTEKKIRTTEFKEKDPTSLQKEIMEKKNMQPHHKERLQKKTDELVKNNDKTGLEQLNKGIDFTDRGGLILHTKEGDLKFAPHAPAYDGIKDIEGIQKNKNVRTVNKASNTEGLRADFDAVKKMQNAGKKFCSDKQFLAVANIFPGGDELNEHNRSNKVKYFFDLLGVKQFGFRVPDGEWGTNLRYLWSASDSGDRACGMGCDGTRGRLDHYGENYGFGVWFLED